MPQTDKIKLLFVDDDPVTASILQRSGENKGYQCQVIQSPLKVLSHIEQQSTHLVITDLRMPDMTGFELLTQIRRQWPDIPVVVMTGHSSVENAVQAMKLGAADFIKKPFDFDELDLIIQRNLEAVKLRNENRQLKKQIKSTHHRYGMIGNSKAVKKLFGQMEKIAEASCNVIINGESGTGKELVARALHEYSSRAQQPLIVVDCGALSDTLLETELFGHEKGAFTGAIQQKTGLMEQSSGGTLFLDEISNISDTMQTKLMRAVDSQSITRVGSTEPIAIDLRIIAASNRDLQLMVEQEEFRHDFYYRLNVVSIDVPPLSARREDIPLLIKHFLKKLSVQYKKYYTGFDTESMTRLINADWSGNIRQLGNQIERCAILGDNAELYWGGHDVQNPRLNRDAKKRVQFVFENDQLMTLEQLEYHYIEQVLRTTHGAKTKAANLLGIDKTTLWRKLQRYSKSSDNN